MPATARQTSGRQPPLDLARSRKQCDGFTYAKAQDYCRLRDLPRLLPAWPAELADKSAEGRRKIIAKLRRALREERRRGLCGHWAYDLARHAGLFRAYQAELAAERPASSGSLPECAHADRIT
jgi:hypothetical protein